MANVTTKGRRRTTPFVMIEHRLLDSQAWAGLSGTAAKLLLRMARLYDGSNNGAIVLGERQAADTIGVSRATIGKAFDELEVAGFIVATARGHFAVKLRQATTWRLTFQPTAQKPATHDYRDNSRV